MGVGAVAVTPFDTTQITSSTNRSQPRAGDTGHPLSATAHPPAIVWCPDVAFLRECGAGYSVAGTLDATSAKHTERAATVFQIPVGVDIYNHTITGDVSVTMCSKATLRGGHGVMPAVAYGISSDALERSGESVEGGSAKRSGLGIDEGLSPCLKGRANAVAAPLCLTPWDTQQRRVFDAAAGVFPSLDACANRTGGHRGPPSLMITDQRGHDGHGVAPTLRAKATSNDFTPMLLRDTVVRRLTPRECERLQGFPDDHTLIPYKGKPATDGHRYKALGNSMAVPVMRWIGERIQQEDARSDQPKSSS